MHKSTVLATAIKAFFNLLCMKSEIILNIKIRYMRTAENVANLSQSNLSFFKFK